MVGQRNGMILSFKDRETEQVYNGIVVKSFPPDILRRALTKLLMIASEQNINDLRTLHPII